VNDLGEGLGDLGAFVQNLSDDVNDDAAFRSAWLGVTAGLLVLHEGKTSKLLYDIFGTMELLPLEGQHRVIAVEHRELAAVFEALEETPVIVHLKKLLHELIELEVCHLIRLYS